MSDLVSEYARRVDALIESFGTTLDADELERVKHLARHDEYGEALLALAWILHNTKKTASRDAVLQIVELSDGLVSKEHMPPDFEKYGDS